MLAFDSISSNVPTKNPGDFESMYDAYLQLMDAAVSDDSVAYEQILQQYPKIFVPADDGYHDLIISDYGLASKLSTAGAVQVSDTVYIFEEDAIYKYGIAGEYKLLSTYVRNKPLTRDGIIIQEIGYNYTFDRYRVSGERSVVIKIFIEAYGDYGVSFGGHSRYYKGSSGNWKIHRGDNSIEFSYRYFEYYVRNGYGKFREISNGPYRSNTRNVVNLTASENVNDVNTESSFNLRDPVVKYWRNSDYSGDPVTFEYPDPEGRVD
ncbi:MAG: hypothetical protein AB7D05_00400 [Mangrovibacterium sp.]